MERTARERCPNCGARQIPLAQACDVELYTCGTRAEYENGGDMVETLRCHVSDLIRQCESRIDHLQADRRSDADKKRAIIIENRLFIIRLQAACER